MNPTGEKSELDLALQRAVAAAGPLPEAGLARSAWLRRELGPDLARGAAELLELRGRAVGKLPDAERLWLSGPALEQATHPEVAAARAERVGSLLVAAARPWILDGTCGLGSDAAALARRGLAVLALDRDPEVAACARHDLAVWGVQVPVVLGDVLQPPVASRDRWILVADPSRRAHGRRSLRPADWSPPWPALARELPAYRGACVKLAPAARPEELETDLDPALVRHWQWTSRRGELAELCLWTGVLAKPEPGAEGGREAQILGRAAGGGADAATQRYHGPGARPADLAPLEAPENARFVQVADPTLVASGLLGPLARAHGLAPLGPGIAFLGGDGPARAAGLCDYAVRGTAKLDRKAVRRLLGEHGVGRVTVLARGLSQSADELARELRGPGSDRGLLVATRSTSGGRVWLVEESKSVRI